jgi:hypothetical protein
MAEGRRTPLDAFLYLRAGPVHEAAQMPQDGPALFAI